MSIQAERLPELAVNPSVSSEVFKSHEDSSYWIGRIATNGCSKDNSEYYDALARFRANVYVDQMGFLGSEHKDALGRELDVDDERSVHFGVIEHQSSGIGESARIVGSSRLIIKQSMENPLPIEKQFPEIFEHSPAKMGATEVSRFISRHEHTASQHAVTLGLIRAMTYYTVKKNVNAAYFIVEKPFLKLLNVLRLPVEILGEPKETKEPGGLRTLHPICLNPDLVLKSAYRDVNSRFSLREFFIQEEINSGEGFYPKSLIGGVNE